MSHPFFDALTYPWHRPEARRLHEVLMQAISNPQRIDLLYRSCKDGLSPLALNNAPDVIWKDALENLTTKSALRTLLDKIASDSNFTTDQILSAVRAVIDAKPDASNAQSDSGSSAPFLRVSVPPPLDPERIVGREALLDNLVNRLLTSQSPVLATDGPPGVGKTTLAVLIAHDKRIRVHFVDGVLWAGLGQTPDVPSVQVAWAEELGVDLGDANDTQTRQDSLSRRVGSGRVLVVLDDAWDIESASALRLSGTNVRYLLTTRNEEIARLFGDGTRPTKVPVLTNEDAWQLLYKLAQSVCEKEPTAARELSDSVGGLPIAVELLGGYLGVSRSSKFGSQRNRAVQKMSDSQELLKLAKVRLGSVSGKEEKLAEVIQLSIEELQAVDSSAVDAFFALGAFAPKPASFDLSAIEAVTGANDDIIGLLAERNLVEVTEDERIVLHQVIAGAARARMNPDAVVNHRNYYLGGVNANRQDWKVIAGLYPQIKHAWLAAQPLDTETAVSFVVALSVYQERQGLWQDQLEWSTTALELAQADGHVTAIGTLHNEIGGVYSSLGEKEKALQVYNQALPLRRQIGDKGGEATTLSNIGLVYDSLGEKEKALQFYNQALPLRRQVGDKRGEAITTLNVARTYLEVEDNVNGVHMLIAFYQVYTQLNPRMATALGFDPWAKRAKEHLQQTQLDNEDDAAGETSSGEE